MDYILILRKEKKKVEEELTRCCTKYKASKRSDVGNDPRSRFGSALASIFFFFSFSYVFSSIPNLMNPLTPPLHVYLKKKPFGVGVARPGELVASS